MAITQVQKRIKDLMQKQNLTANALTIKSGLTKSAVHNVIYGKNNNFNAIGAIASALDVPLSHFYIETQNIDILTSIKKERIKDFDNDLYARSVEITNNTLQKKGLKLPVEEFIKLTLKTYLFYSENKNSIKTQGYIMGMIELASKELVLEDQ